MLFVCLWMCLESISMQKTAMATPRSTSPFTLIVSVPNSALNPPCHCVCVCVRVCACVCACVCRLTLTSQLSSLVHSFVAVAPNVTEYESVMILALRGADTHVVNKQNQRPLVMSEDEVMIKTLVAVDKNSHYFLSAEDGDAKSILPASSSSHLPNRRRSGSVSHRPKSQARAELHANAFEERQRLVGE